MTPEQIEQMRADMQAGTPGHWGMETKRTSCGVCHQVGPWPHKWRAGDDMSACIYDDYPSPPEGTDSMLANARHISRVPDMEAEILRLRAALDGIYVYANDTLSGRDDGPDDRDWQRAGIVEIRNRAREFATSKSAIDALAGEAP